MTPIARCKTQSDMKQRVPRSFRYPGVCIVLPLHKAQNHYPVPLGQGDSAKLQALGFLQECRCHRRTVDEVWKRGVPRHRSLKRHVKNLDHVTLPETKDFNALHDA